MVIYASARVLERDRITFGDHVIIDDFVFVGRHEELVIGNYVHIASHASITGGGRCVIADFAGISSGARILTGTDEFAGGGLTGPTVPDDLRVVRRGVVVIESHAVIGVNSVVLPGVTVGEGATVGANSVVTRDLAPWTIHAGAPARPLRERDRRSVLDAEERLYVMHGRPSVAHRRPTRGAP
ncbi:MAG TPA: acyltransferase [Candidatus Binatia bacterium]|nr:acyltransferase [Candidatus Binatia bacterium]